MGFAKDESGVLGLPKVQREGACLHTSKCLLLQAQHSQMS